MPKISEDIIRTVLEQAKIEDVVSDFVTLRKAGVNMTGICPFHDDQHDGNFIVRPSTISEANHGNTYRCFVCDAKGGPVQFLMNAEHMTFPDAIRYLGKKYCIDVDNVAKSIVSMSIMYRSTGHHRHHDRYRHHRHRWRWSENG